MKKTPMLQQYLELKGQYPDALLLYRLGDFYELFFEDAERAAPVLGVVLTRRRHNESVESPMCGIPHHALSSYLGKLLEAGFKVAIAEQVEEPQGQRLVRREVTRLVTPSTATEPELLPAGERRFLMAMAGKGPFALAAAEAGAGELWGLFPASEEEVRELFLRLQPKELLLPQGIGEWIHLWPAQVKLPLVTYLEKSRFFPARGEEEVKRAFGVGSLRGVGLEPGEEVLGPLAALLSYLAETHGSTPQHFVSFQRLDADQGLILDAATVRNLELLRDSSGGTKGSLAAVLDDTCTPMGARLLREWLARPAAPAVAAERHAAVAELMEQYSLHQQVRERLRQVGDLQRVAARLGLQQARPGELAALREALPAVAALRQLLQQANSNLLLTFAQDLDTLQDLQLDLQTTLAEHPPAVLGPGTIAWGVDETLDAVRRLAHGAKEVLAEVEARERERTGIASLKVRYNSFFGYAFEVSKANLDKVPAHWVRRQTLTQAERFVTEELSQLEQEILTAEKRAEQRERELFQELQARLASQARRVAAAARILAALDVLAAFAQRAREQRYCRPRLVEVPVLRLEHARHPVVEAIGTEPFVPNDLDLAAEERQILILTGPNMGGKSTFLRQVALAVVMARAGSFVAADAAEIGPFDRIFTRVGAADDIARGESTFMVEMSEVAHILRHATKYSLVVLDEVGRGTATYDGLSLAWAVVEHLHGFPGGGPLVLFATHYHELTELAQQLPRVVNASMAVKEWQGKVFFLHRVVPGPADRSYGIHVARLAGVPEGVCQRAEEILAQLSLAQGKVPRPPEPHWPRQLSLFAEDFQWLADRLRELNLEQLTPLAALNLLAEWKKEVGP
ncbi:MAG: DNA mismatch repair protein MutS [Thermoanaerobaculum sp.]|nr:DNA mismatch repair protein MutS [Thermoanaerobaculum sp.]